MHNDGYLVNGRLDVVDHVRDQRQLEQQIHAVYDFEPEGVYFGG